MDTLPKPPAIELLEANHRFPSVYMFKAIGRTDNHFVARLVAAVREELAAPHDPPHRIRMAADGRHVSVTLEPIVLSADEVLAVYSRIRMLTGLVMMF